MEARSRSIPGVQKTLAAAGALARLALRLMGETIPVSVALMLLATQPVLAQPFWNMDKISSGGAIRGQSFPFRIVVANIGNATTSGLVTVTDFVPTGLTATASRTFSGATPQAAALRCG
jgi:uncharacterized repeat protein (TIGR01451 family)